MYDETLKYIREELKNNMDIDYRNIYSEQGLITLIFSHTITDKNYISKYIVTPLVENNKVPLTIDNVKNKILFSSIIGEANKPEEAVLSILSGNVVILFEFLEKIIFCHAKKIAERAIERPISDPVSKGPQQGFNENIEDNISLLRKRIKSPLLKIEKLTVGGISKTAVIIIYIESKVSEDLVDLVRTKIKNIKQDFIIDTNYIEEELKCQDTNFDTIGYTEKPDIIVSRLFEGKVAVMVDGSPTAITAPSFFLEYFHAPDDYYINKNIVSGVRILRMISFTITILLPGFYIALFTNHFSLIPQIYVFKIAADRAGVPLPTAVEVSLMLFFFEITRETGRRLPASIGQSVSIVSSLVLGETATRAGLASQGTVIIMAIYAMTSFMNPKLSAITPYWSFVNIVVCSFFGLHGFYIYCFLAVASAAGLKTCGYPYLFPLGTDTKYFFNEGDFLIRGRLSQISNKIFKGRFKG